MSCLTKKTHNIINIYNRKDDTLKYTLNCNLSEQDYLEFNTYVLNNSKENKKFKTLLLIILSIFELSISIPDLIAEQDIVLIIITVISIIIIPLIVLFILDKTFTPFLKLYLKIIKKHGKLPYSENSIMEFYDEYLIEKTDVCKRELRYDGIEKVAINKTNTIYIFENSILAYIIPANTFSSDNEREEFINFIKEKTRPAA